MEFLKREVAGEERENWPEWVLKNLFLKTNMEKISEKGKQGYLTQNKSFVYFVICRMKAKTALWLGPFPFKKQKLVI